MRTILVVDDNSALRDAVSKMVEAAGYPTLSANGGAAALDILDATSASIGAVITDLHMAGMDGSALATAIAHRFPGVPVILCSGSGIADLEEVRASTRAAATLAKPFRRQKLAEVLAAVALP